MPKTPEEYLEEAVKLIGAETEMAYGRYPVEADSIRRYCHMTDDPNPLFMEPEYARGVGHPTTPCPPLQVGYFANRGYFWPPPDGTEPALPEVPTPSPRPINLTTEWEFYQQVYVGDQLSYKRRYADIYMKPIRMDPKAIWIVTEVLVYNQRGDLVAKGSNLGLRHRTPEDVKAAGD
jgi:acyl dehydratase